MLMLHLVTAFPIITNPPAQMFEEMLNIPAGIINPVNKLFCIVSSLGLMLTPTVDLETVKSVQPFLEKRITVVKDFNQKRFLYIDFKLKHFCCRLQPKYYLYRLQLEALLV